MSHAEWISSYHVRHKETTPVYHSDTLKASLTLSHQTFQLLTRTLHEIGFKRGWKSLIHD